MASFGTAGFCYGMNGDGKPSSAEVAKICRKYGIPTVRLYYPDKDALDALRNSNIEVVLGVPNTELVNLASDAATATKWVRDNVTSSENDNVTIKYIVVGNEVDPQATYAKHLLPAMKNVRNAISAANLNDKIAVSTAILGNGVLEHFDDRPSAASFQPQFKQLIEGIIEFLVTQANPAAPLLVNVHPYLVHEQNANSRLDYALFTATEPVVRDGKYNYYNLFDAIIDAVCWALGKIHVNADSLKIVASETGWPSAGGKDATPAHASTYVGNLVKHLTKGTPRRPGKPIETYIKAMFDESKNPNPEFNRHWGVFLQDGVPKYPPTPTQSA